MLRVAGSDLANEPPVYFACFRLRYARTHKLPPHTARGVSFDGVDQMLEFMNTDTSGRLKVRRTNQEVFWRALSTRPLERIDD
jgi:hypothetical protein